MTLSDGHHLPLQLLRPQLLDLPRPELARLLEDEGLRPRLMDELAIRLQRAYGVRWAAAKGRAIVAWEQRRKRQPPRERRAFLEAAANWAEALIERGMSADEFLEAAIDCAPKRCGFPTPGHLAGYTGQAAREWVRPQDRKPVGCVEGWVGTDGAVYTDPGDGGPPAPLFGSGPVEDARFQRWLRGEIDPSKPEEKNTRTA